MYTLKKYVLAFQKYNFIKKSVQYVYCYTITIIGIIYKKKNRIRTHKFTWKTLYEKNEKKNLIYEEIDIKGESCK